MLINRIQTAGPSQVNVPVETIYELGNYKSIGQVRDTPDLSFSLESYDVSTDLEALLLNVDPSGGYPYDPANAIPMDIKSLFKSGLGTASPFAEVASVALPYLTLESLSYRFGLSDDARQTVGLRGDSIYYNPGSTYIETTAGTNSTSQAIVSAHAAYGVTEGGVFRRILSVCQDGKRLVNGIDFVETYGTVTAHAAVTTITMTAKVPTTSNVRIMYSSPVAETFLQSVHEAVSATKPAAIRGRDIAVYLGGYDSAHPFTNRLLGVQAVNVDWKVNLEKDEEFGNYHYVDQDFDVPTVTGSVQVKPVDPAAMIAFMQEITGTDPTTFASAPATNAPLIPLDIVLHSPTDGSVLKRISIDDARITLPGFSAQVQQRLTFTANFTSDQGDLAISQT